MEFELVKMNFDNCEKAYEIDRSDIPYSFVEDVPTLIDILEYGAENDLTGHAFMVMVDDRCVGTIMIGEGLVGDKDPDEVQERPFYRLMFFVLDKEYRGQGLGSKVLEAAISRAYEDFGVRPIVLEVQKDNENAARFYERNGFTRTSYRVGEDYYFVRGL